MAVHDLYREFSDGVAGALERGDVPWTPAAAGRPVKYNGRPYGGVSVLAQWSAARERGHDSPVWLTRGTIEALDGRVSAAAAPVTLWCAGMRPVESPSRETGELVIRPGAVWRPYAAWNVEDVEGLAERFARVGAVVGREAASERLASLAETAGGAAPAAWVDGNGGLAQDAERDPLAVCRGLVRQTGHPARLNRRVGEAQESLTVEIGAAFLAADLRLDAAGRPAGEDVEAWCRLLKADDLAIFRSARDATHAVEHIHAMAPGHRVEVAPPRIHPALSERVAVAARTVPGDRVRPDEIARMRAVDAARQFVAAAEAHRKDVSGGDPADRRGRALLEAADRIDLAVPGVADAVRAAAFLHGAGGRVGADSYLAEFRRETKDRLQAAEVTEPVEAPVFRPAGVRM